ERLSVVRAAEAVVGAALELLVRPIAPLSLGRLATRSLPRTLPPFVLPEAEAGVGVGAAPPPPAYRLASTPDLRAVAALRNTPVRVEVEAAEDAKLFVDDTEAMLGVGLGATDRDGGGGRGRSRRDAAVELALLIPPRLARLAGRAPKTEARVAAVALERAAAPRLLLALLTPLIWLEPVAVAVAIDADDDARDTGGTFSSFTATLLALPATEPRLACDDSLGLSAALWLAETPRSPSARLLD
ncbi:unnamed protein product, partial [Tilletia caries]